MRKVISLIVARNGTSWWDATLAVVSNAGK